MHKHSIIWKVKKVQKKIWSIVLNETHFMCQHVQQSCFITNEVFAMLFERSMFIRHVCLNTCFSFCQAKPDIQFTMALSFCIHLALLTLHQANSEWTYLINVVLFSYGNFRVNTIFDVTLESPLFLTFILIENQKPKSTCRFLTLCIS